MVYVVCVVFPCGVLVLFPALVCGCVTSGVVCVSG
jgi:hypothetical protein